MFKKSATSQKIGDCVGSSSNQVSSDQSSGVDLHSEGRCEDVDGSASDYQMPMETTSSLTPGSTPNHTRGSNDENWMRYLADDAFSLTNQPLPNCGVASYPPSKVI